MAQRGINTVDDVVALLENDGTELCLNCCYIGDEGAQVLAAALPLCTALQKLFLYSNDIGDDGAGALAEGLPQCTALQELYLHRNCIGSDGARTLAAALPQCTALQRLVLSNNYIGEDGARALAATLPQCTALQTLELERNNIGGDGARALASALPQCPSLQTLDLYNNHIARTLIQQIKSELERNSQPDRVQQAAAKLAQAQAERAARMAAMPQAVAMSAQQVLQHQRDLESERVRLQQKEAELKEVQRALEVERVRQQQMESELLQRETTVRQREQALDAIKREQEAQQRAKDLAAAFTKAKKDVAAAKQAEILEERHAEGSTYVVTRDAVSAAWEPTKVKLSDCPVHARPLTPGQSVLLEKCLHTICRDCAPHMIQPDNSVRCPICQVNSPLKLDSLPYHPFIEAELAVGEARDCMTCSNDPDEEVQKATENCTTCNPHKHLCYHHASLHRVRMPAHAVTPLAPGGAALGCLTHNRPVEAYCTGCRELICLACTLTTHPAPKHAARLLTDTAFVEGIRARLVEGAALARTVAEALIGHAADATIALTEVDERDDMIASEIKRTINVLAGILERHREAAHDQLQAHSRDERAALQTTREESEYHWRIVTSAADLAEQLALGTHLGVNATAVMVQLEAAATARLHAVVELAPERGVPPPAILRFHVDESLSEQLAHLGEVVQDAP